MSSKCANKKRPGVVSLSAAIIRDFTGIIVIIQLYNLYMIFLDPISIYKQKID